uniref:(northern house mosquito) hypothetical protein n=1 Tax=Culex pipiens TaxID=7175 RepID=A0A8D8G0B6_CULPI
MGSNLSVPIAYYCPLGWGNIYMKIKRGKYGTRQLTQRLLRFEFLPGLLDRKIEGERSYKWSLICHSVAARNAGRWSVICSKVLFKSGEDQRRLPTTSPLAGLELQYHAYFATE